MLLYPLYVLFVIEVLLSLLLIFPIPLLQNATKGLISISKSAAGGIVVKTLCGALAVLLGSSALSIWDLLKSYVHTSDGSSTTHYLQQRERICSESLEAVLMGSCLVMVLLLERLHGFMADNRKLNLDFQVLKKQAAGAAEYLKTQGKAAEPRAKNNDEARAVSSPKEVDTVKWEKEIARLKAELADMAQAKESSEMDAVESAKIAKAAEANLVAFKKQTANQAAEYDRLLDENENLRAQLASFDYSYSRSGAKKAE